MVFTVTPRGTYDTRILLENPQEDFPRRLVEELPARFIADLKEAAKCLVFDIPVGCAFHVCRATESLMLAYYEELAKQQWPLPKNRDWNSYIQHLGNAGAPTTITARLDEIRKMDTLWMDPQKSYLKLQLMESVTPSEGILRLLREDPNIRRLISAGS
jgi:hypothetical protein